MKKSLFLSIPMALGCLASASASTTAFSPVTLTQLGFDALDPGPGPTIDGAGLITLTTNHNGLSNQVGFGLTDPGVKTSATFGFTFNISSNGGTADGFSFGFGRTSDVGVAGSGNFGEEMDAAGVLGFGYDTWNNTGPDPGPDGSDFSGISLHWNGARLAQMNDTRLAAPAGLGFAIDNGQDHLVAGSVNFAGGTVTLTVDGQAVFTNFPVPGLAPMESRILMGARTGGEHELATVNGLKVDWSPVPEPTSALLSLLGLAGLVRRRR